MKCPEESEWSVPFSYFYHSLVLHEDWDDSEGKLTIEELAPCLYGYGMERASATRNALWACGLVFIGF